MAALVFGRIGGLVPELASVFLLFAAPLGAMYGAAAGAVLVLWSVFLYVDRHARWPAAVAPIAGCVACAAGLLWPGVLCEVPALGVGLFCAAAAVEAMS